MAAETTNLRRNGGASALETESEEVALALRVLDRVLQLQGESATVARGQLLQAMLAADIDPVPHATVAAAERLARHRARLLASGALTLDALAQVRGDTPGGSATRTWLTRRRRGHEIFTVSHRDATLVPAFQLRADGAPVPAVGMALRSLVPAGFAGWELWTWFTTASAWLSGDSPENLLEAEPAAVAQAALRFVRATGDEGNSAHGEPVMAGPVDAPIARVV